MKRPQSMQCMLYTLQHTKLHGPKKTHKIIEQLFLVCAKEMVRLVFGEDLARKLNNTFVFNDFISRRINNISQNISKQVVDKIKKSQLFAIHLYKSTDISLPYQVLVFARYMVAVAFKKKFFFSKILDTTKIVMDVLEVVNNFFKANDLDWENLVGVTTDCACTCNAKFKIRFSCIDKTACFSAKNTARSHEIIFIE